MNEDVFRAILHFAVQQARLITDDQEALEAKCLYKEWEAQIGRELSVGECKERTQNHYIKLSIKNMQVR